MIQSNGDEPIVITGIGMITSLGSGRESVWQNLRAGRSGVRRLCGLQAIPDGLLIGAPVDVNTRPGELKVVELCQRAASEALRDANIRWDTVDRNRFCCAISGHMGDTAWVNEQLGMAEESDSRAVQWWEQWFPNTACSQVANRYGLHGPRICHSTACASGMIDFLAAVRAIRDEQCDIALAGSAEAFHPLFAAGFYQMRVLAMHDDPQRACRPFDATRDGFVMGEGGAMFVLERLSHARRRGARIYAEVLGGKTMAMGFHITSLDLESDALAHLISATLTDARVPARAISYINAHGTATPQNDLAEARAIRRAMGDAADRLCVSANKAALGHLVNAAGSVELAITALAMRDQYLPPTLNLTSPDPACGLDCVPLVGRHQVVDYALKISVAFGGHLAAVVLRHWGSEGAVLREVA